MTMTPAPEGCPPAYNGCTCPCHRTPGMFHLVACCRQVVGPDPVPLAEGQDEIPPKRYGVTGSLGASHSHLANYILVDETGDGIWVMHAEWAVMKQERDQARSDLAEFDVRSLRIGLTEDLRGVYARSLAEASNTYTAMMDSVVTLKKERDQLKQQLAQETAAYTRMQGAATNIPSELDVRKIMLNIIPGPDGEGVEINAKNVAEVEEAMTELSDEVELNEGVIESLREVIVKLREECDDARRDRSFYDVALAARDRYMEERDRYMEERDDAVAKLNDALKANVDLQADNRQFYHLPIMPITIQCPQCGHWHVDEDKEVIDGYHGADGEPAGVAVKRNWAKHPHSTHRCAYCNHEWQPFPIKMPTVGVAPKLTSKEEDQWSIKYRELRNENDRWATAAADLAWRLGAEIGTIKTELAHFTAQASTNLERAERLQKERDDAKAEAKMYMDRDNGENKALLKERDEARELCRSAKADVTSLRGLLKDAEQERNRLYNALVTVETQRDVARQGPTPREGSHLHEILTKAGIADKQEYDLEDRIGWLVADRDRLKSELAMPVGPDRLIDVNGDLLTVGEFVRDVQEEIRIRERAEADRDRFKQERDEAKTAWDNMAKEVRERTVACENLSRELAQAKDEYTKRGHVNAELLKERDEARELCRSAKADVTTLRGLCKDLENKIQAMVQANAASAWGIAERDKMMKERDAALHQEEIALAALRALRKEADVFEADRDLARGTITELRQELDLLTGNLQVIKAQRDNFMEGYDQARKEIDALNMRGMSDPIQLLIGERDMARMERDETRRLVNDVCTKLAVPMMSTHDRVQRLADWYLAVRDEHESLVKERDQIREGYRELNSRHVALVEHWAPLKGSASEQALPKSGQGAIGTTPYPPRADHWQRLADDRNQILTEIDTLAVNMGCSEHMGTIQKVRWLVGELAGQRQIHKQMCKEVEAENWAVLEALQQPGTTEKGTWTAMTRLQQIQALVRDRDAWRSIAQVCGYKGKDDLRIVPIPDPGQGAIGTTPYPPRPGEGAFGTTLRPGPPRNPDPIGGYGHPEGLTILECQSETLAILVHLHLAGSGWSTDRDLENALAEWCQVRYDRAKGMIKRGPAMDLLTKAVDAWCAQKVKGTK